MRLSGFSKLCVISGAALVIMIGMAGHTTEASNSFLQATSTASGSPSSSMMTTAMATAGMMSTTSMTFAACPATASGSTTGSTTSATAASTMASGNAVMSATMSATTSAGTGSAGTGSRGYLGIRAAAVDSCGIRVVGVIAGSPAVTSGLQVGDVIVALNGSALATMFTSPSMAATGSATMMATSSGTGSAATAAVSSANAANTTNTNAFFNFLQGYTSGQTVTLTIQRAGQQRDISVTLGTIPPGLVTPAGGAVATAAK